MFQENELITFIVVLGIGIFLLANRKRMEPRSSYSFLLVSFVFYAAASILTLLETFWLAGFFNFMEHVCILGHTLSFTIWIWLLIKQPKELGT